MTTILFSHPACLGHDNGHGHPESAKRLQALLDRLDDPEFEGLVRRSAPCADRSQLARAHAEPYIAKVFDTHPAEGEAFIAPDTVMSPGSLAAALRASGAVCAAVDAVLGGQATNAFCAVRPPGHHATAVNTMGFCIFNNVAVGVEQARRVHGVERVAIVDFDVHHGNGSEAIYRADPNVMVASIHQSLIFPKTGSESDVGVGNIVNVPMVRKAPPEKFRAAFKDRIIPRLMEFAPEVLFVSAGFDAHVRDPLGDQRLKTDDFAWLTGELTDVAESRCDGRLVSTLEGGYDEQAVADAGAAHIGALMAHAQARTVGRQAIGKMAGAA